MYVAFLLFSFWRAKSPCILLNKNINFNKNKRESRETNLVLKQFFSSFKNCKLKLNCDKLELAKAKRGHFFYHLFCLKKFFLTFVSMYSVLNALLEYIYFYISKTLLHTLLLLVFEIVESFHFSGSLIIWFSLKKLHGPSLWMEFNCLMAKATLRRQFTF